MMHQHNIVVAIANSEKKTLRELNFSNGGENKKSCDIHLPFDSEYQFMVKNSNFSRVLIQIEVDGTVVTDDGVIINGVQTAYLERFVNSDRKFKFVKASNEAVADPTNLENGIVRVDVYEEMVAPVMLMNHINHFPANQWNTPIGSPTIWGTASVNSVLRGCNAPSEAGATVEGAVSNQSFGSTTWRGNGKHMGTFTFKMRGTSRSAADEVDYQNYLKLKDKFEAK